MKTLKFKPELIPLVLNGTKYTTWRCFDDKNIQVGDEMSLLNWVTKEEFAIVQVTRVIEKPYKDINADDRKGHEVLSPEQEVLNYKQYYGDRWTEDTLVKIIYFRLI